MLSPFVSRALTAVLVVGVVVAVFAGPAAAPSPFSDAWEAQTAMGYHPCRPMIGPLPQERIDAGYAADADNGQESGVCRIRVAWDLPDELLDMIAWHEMCHESTTPQIYADPESAQGSRPPAPTVHTVSGLRACGTGRVLTLSSSVRFVSK